MHDNDHIAPVPVARRRPAPRPAESTESTASELDLPRQMGNRAFTRHVSGREPASATGGTAGGGLGVQREAARRQGAGPLDPEIEADIRSARGAGHSLDDHVRQNMESHLGVDLSAVRVHADARGDALSRSVQADAFTTGTDVFFRSGHYAPDSREGRKLLAHELTHVVQQASGAVPAESRVSHPDDPHEREASAVAETVTASTLPASTATPAPASVTRQASEEELDEEETAVARQATEEELEEELDEDEAKKA